MENEKEQIDWWNSLSMIQQKKWLSMFVNNLKTENTIENKIHTSNSKPWNNGNIKLKIDNYNGRDIDLSRRMRVDIELLKYQNCEIKKSQSESKIICNNIEYQELAESVPHDMLYEVFNNE